MARTPKKTTQRQSTRPTRAASVSFKNEDDFDPVQDDVLDEDVDMDGGSEDSTEMLNRFLSEYKKREARKNSARTAAFQTQKKALYAAARQAAKDLAREGTACLEEGKAMILALKKEELSAEVLGNNVAPQWANVEASVRALLDIYPTGVEDLFPRRSNSINAASEMLRANPSRRAEALAECVETADSQLHQSQLDKTTAADASNLIKYYKGLLLSG
ncbi:hypothetical protein MSAN_01036800 [Mycena sanguinolenta]|uniref:Uncharacterized protein n=1 Tax=Mycena sanguinolenta TaxID=230812 RepID=A0A8H7D670_9AGAR|nr:hypothetical protein MSAN_01036800 [Mycena sanguinolenta]